MKFSASLSAAAFFPLADIRQAVFGSAFAACLAFAISAASAVAQTTTPTPTATPSSSSDAALVTEGIVGDIDAHRRGPVLSVGVQRHQNPNYVSLLTDAYVSNGEFTRYPIRFDFYVNRKLFSSQIRSAELPGSVGVDIGEDVATIPFNYTIVATVLHPNRLYTTVLQAAVEPQAEVTTLDCTLSLTKINADGTDGSENYVGNGVEISKNSSGSYSVSFVAPNETNTAQASISASITTASDSTSSDLTASAPVKVTVNSTTNSVDMTGTLTVESNAVTDLSLDAEDGSFLHCS